MSEIEEQLKRQVHRHSEIIGIDDRGHSLQRGLIHDFKDAKIRLESIEGKVDLMGEKLLEQSKILADIQITLAEMKVSAKKADPVNKVEEVKKKSGIDLKSMQTKDIVKIVLAIMFATYLFLASIGGLVDYIADHADSFKKTMTIFD